MSVERHLTTFHGLPVVEFPPQGRAGGPLPAAGEAAWRLRLGWDSEEGFPQLWERFAAAVDLPSVRALIVGHNRCEPLDGPAARLVADAGRLTALRALFMGDMVREESDIAYIEQADPAPLLAAFPALEEFGARGTGKACGPLDHGSLRVLRFESGGLPAAWVGAVARARLPKVEELVLWLGVEEYGGDATVADLAPLLEGGLLPSLRHLTLGDSGIQDDIAAAVASAPVVARLETLSLAMGILTDEGAESLLNGQPLTHLASLDLHHHFLSGAMAGRVRAALAPAGVEVDLDGRQEGEEDEDEGTVWRYVAVAE